MEKMMKKNKMNSIVIFVVMMSLLVIVSIYRMNQSKLAPTVSKNKLTNQTTNKSFKELLAKNIDLQLNNKEEIIERKDFDTSVLSKERIFTEKEIIEMSEKQFIELLKDIELKLPKISDIKSIPPAALHRTPAPVLQAGRELGLIKEILNAHDNFEIKSLPFYDRCAKEITRPTPVRALCLTNLVQLKKKLGLKINTKDYPNEIIDLARMVMDI